MEIGSNMFIPCNIGDEVYAIRKFNNSTPKIKKGIVSQMFFVGREMRLSIVVSNIARGEWGKTVFGSFEDAEARLSLLTKNHKGVIIK